MGPAGTSDNMISALCWSQGISFHSTTNLAGRSVIIMHPFGDVATYIKKAITIWRETAYRGRAQIAVIVIGNYSAQKDAGGDIA